MNAFKKIILSLALITASTACEAEVIRFKNNTGMPEIQVKLTDSDGNVYESLPISDQLSCGVDIENVDTITKVEVLHRTISGGFVVWHTFDRGHRGEFMGDFDKTMNNPENRQYGLEVIRSGASFTIKGYISAIYKSY